MWVAIRGKQNKIKLYGLTRIPKYLNNILNTHNLNSALTAETSRGIYPVSDSFSCITTRKKHLRALTGHLLEIGDFTYGFVSCFLTPREIAIYIWMNLNKENIRQLSYKNWLFKEGNWNIVTSLPDKSRMDSRYGKDENYYGSYTPGKTVTKNNQGSLIVH